MYSQYTITQHCFCVVVLIVWEKKLAVHELFFGIMFDFFANNLDMILCGRGSSGPYYPALIY